LADNSHTLPESQQARKAYEQGADFVSGLPVRLLIAEDSNAFRRFLSSTLRKERNVEILCEVSDGWEAVQKSKELRPDLILLDIGLPKMNGIEAARKIREFDPQAKILFVSNESSPEVAGAAISAGGCGYIIKTHAGSELLTAVDAALSGQCFISRSLFEHCLDMQAWPIITHSN
jgi:DNA-binding NarL/FixJ family response regulator